MKILNVNICKIEPIPIIFFSLKMKKMKVGKVYAVESKTRLCIGRYIGRIFDDDDDDEHYVLKDVIQKNKPFVSYFMRKPRKIKPNAVFSPNDIVYDLEEIRENGKQARHAMERRALDIILKRIVNETFEW
jgi:hypothetical protein